MTFQVSFKDLAGNEGLSFSTGNTKTVKIDTQPPNLTKVSLSSLGNENKTLAKAGQYIELKFDASENLKDPMVSIHGKNIQLYGIQDTWTATYQVDENDDLALNPLDLDGLKLWLDSSNIDGEYNATIESGDQVERWNDLSSGNEYVNQIL